MADASLVRLGNSARSQISNMLVRKGGPASEIAAREGASPSIAYTRMTAVSMKVAGVSVHCTIMKALPIQPIGGRRHSGRTFQAMLGTKCPQETCWGIVVLAGGLREQLDLLKRTKSSVSVSTVHRLALTRATLTGFKPVHNDVKRQQATVLERSDFLPSSGTSLDQPASTSGLELSALQSNQETGAKELEFALNDPVVMKLRQGNHEDVEALAGPNLRDQAVHMLENMGKGTISVSAYDTAWLARLPAPESPVPLFPKALEWLIANQLPDGSWGDPVFIMYHDRILSTLSALVALRTWGAAPAAIARGERFVRAHVGRLALEAREMATIGFELVFPSLMETAQQLGLDLPYDHPHVKSVEAVRARKLARLPLEVVYAQPTSVLYSLEAFEDTLDFQRLLAHQQPDGSFLCSPAATASVYLHTQNPKALAYLQSLSEAFDGAAPNAYPVDLFEPQWVVSKIKRLGLEPILRKQVEKVLAYVAEKWSDNGMAWASESLVKEVDDTSVAFRLLREGGYDVSPKALEQFCDDQGNFFCFEGELEGGVSHMINLFHASQVRTEEESILEAAERFARRFLSARLAAADASTCPWLLKDKWVISGGLRRDAELCLEGGSVRPSMHIADVEEGLARARAGQVHIGKVLYAMPVVDSPVWAALAREELDALKARIEEETADLKAWIDSLLISASSKAFLSTMGEAVVYQIANKFPAREEAPLRAACYKVGVLNFLFDNRFLDCMDGSVAIGDLEAAQRVCEDWAASGARACAEGLVARAVVEGRLRNEELAACLVVFLSTIEELARAASEQQGWDVAPFLAREHVGGFAADVEEARRARDPSTGPASLEAYLEVARSTVTTDLFVALICVLSAGVRVPASVPDSPQYIHIRDLVAIGTRLTNDLHTYVKEKSEGTAETANAVGVLMKRQGLAESEARSKVQAMVDESFESLHQELSKSRARAAEDGSTAKGHLPHQVVQHSFTFLKSSMDFYYNSRFGASGKSWEQWSES